MHAALGGTGNQQSRQHLQNGTEDGNKMNFGQLLQSKGPLQNPQLAAQQIDQFQFNSQNNQQ